MLKNKFKIGIVGGAGPTAGSFLFQKIIEICQKKYACYKDNDFPYIMLLNYPFNDMLGEDFDRSVIQNQLNECLRCFEQNDIRIAAIACNTLHSFLPPQINNFNLVHIIKETRDFLKINKWSNPLILCSTTAAKNKLHAHYFECTYANLSIQKKIDDLIDAVTAGCCLREASLKLSDLIEKDGPVVLGCTELSVVHEAHPLQFSKVCNPSEILAQKICELTFNH